MCGVRLCPHHNNLRWLYGGSERGSGQNPPFVQGHVGIGAGSSHIV